MTKKLKKLTSSDNSTSLKPINGHLTLKESKRTIMLTWGKYSITALCLTAITIALIQKIRF
jgi:hypothetical protein